MTTTTAPTDAAPTGRDESEVADGVQRFFGTVAGFMSFQALVLAHRSGVLATLRQGPGTAAQIADRAATHERSTRELLAALTAAGYLRHDDGVFTMPAGQAALFDGAVLPFDPTVLLDFSDVMAGLVPDLVRSLEDGGGVPYAAYQPRFSAAQDAMTAPLYAQFLVDEWVASVDGLTERLRAGIDVADIGCGGGRALCLLAARFPASRFTGYDVDEAALALGRARALDGGLTNLHFEHQDVAALELSAAVDLVLAVDAVHDQARPLDVVARVRRALRPEGVFLMVEPTASGDLDTDVQDPMAVVGYVMSLTHCIPVSLAEGGPGLGGMWGRVGALALLEDAEFLSVDAFGSPSDYTVYAARP